LLNHKTNHIPNPTTLKKSSNKFGEKAEKTREEISMMCSWLAQKKSQDKPWIRWSFLQDLWTQSCAGMVDSCLQIYPHLQMNRSN
ncbi:hypothetical protein BAE44_0015555, partial [Dichanthelium oligosanthes]